jgi:hypothetical protein
MEMTGKRKLVNVLLAVGLLFVSYCAGATAQTRHPDVASLSRNSREIFTTAMQWGDKSWDAKSSLCLAPDWPEQLPANPHAHEVRFAEYKMVRESSWYALGLLLRDGPGDRERAAKVIDAILNQQYHAPGKVWDGTFRRSPNEPDPGDRAVMWKGYDPNWRVFIGSTFAVIMNEYPDRVPSELKQRMMASINYALQGEMHEGRLQPSYTNIALMYGYLWSYAAKFGGKPEWAEPAAKWQDEVYRLYKEHDAFNEYNSPTYAGTDFYALALWRDYGLTEHTRAMGRAMEDGLWRATAAFYNANLRNISGPYDRSYGMDMQSYVSVNGLWLRMVLDAGDAPLPTFTPPVDHVGDLWFIPLMVVVDARIPDDAMQTFRGFTGEHEVRRAIEGPRVATAWIGKTLIYGGEITGKTRGVDAASQFHPVTAQWLAPDGRIGWLNMTRTPKIDADATKNGIEIATEKGDVTFRIDVHGLKAADLKAGEWKLAGLDVKLTTDAGHFTVEPGQGYVDVHYAGMTKMKMQFTQVAQ